MPTMTMNFQIDARNPDDYTEVAVAYSPGFHERETRTEPGVTTDPELLEVIEVLGSGATGSDLLLSMTDSEQEHLVAACWEHQEGLEGDYAGRGGR